MASLLNKARRAIVAQTEKKVQRKLNRLQKRGIFTMGIDPRHPVDASDTRALGAYNAELNKWIKSTRYERLGNGEPISKREWKEYKKAERKANERAEKFFTDAAKSQIPRADTDDSEGLDLLNKLSHLNPSSPNIFGRPFKLRNKQPVQIRNRSEFERQKEAYKEQASKSYERTRAESYRRSMADHAKNLNLDKWSDKIKNVSSEAMNRLVNMTDFTEMFYKVMNAMAGSDAVNQMNEALDVTNLQKHLDDLIDSAEQIVKEEAYKALHGGISRKEKNDYQKLVSKVAHMSDARYAEYVKGGGQLDAYIKSERESYKKERAAERERQKKIKAAQKAKAAKRKARLK